MITPTDTHILSGILTKISEDDTVEVELAGEVDDVTIGKGREVDIVVRHKGNTSAIYKAYEVKDHTRPLDVIMVEQLCAKFRDMPDVKTRGIISASGYTKDAKKKAAAHGVELFELVDWKEQRPRMRNIIFWTNDIPMVETVGDWVQTATAQISFQNAAFTLIKPEETRLLPVYKGNGEPLEPSLDHYLYNMGEEVKRQTLNLAMQHSQKTAELIPIALDCVPPDNPYVIINGVKNAINKVTIVGMISKTTISHEVVYKALLKEGEAHPIEVVGLFETHAGHLMGLMYSETKQQHMLITLMKEHRQESQVKPRVL